MVFLLAGVLASMALVSEVEPGEGRAWRCGGGVQMKME